MFIIQSTTMKTCIFTLGILIWNSLQAFATSHVTFAAPAGYTLKVTINGKVQEAEQYVRFDNLASGNHTAQITTTANKESLSFQSTISLPDNQETSYFVLVVNKVAQIHWANETPIQNTESEPAATTQLAKDREKNSTDSRYTDYPQRATTPASGSRPSSGYGSNSTYSRSYSPGRPSSYSSRHYYGRGGQQVYVEPTPTCSFMSNQEMAQLQATVRRIPFDEDRLLVLQHALQYSTFMSADVRELTRLLSFDTSRLKFAKQAFNNTYDKQNYYIVNTAFDFSSSTRELQQYIQSCH